MEFYDFSNNQEQHQSHNDDSSNNAGMPVLGMKWHNFLIYFALFLGAALNIYSGVMQFMGYQYGENAVLVYEQYPGITIYDMVVGVCLIALGIFQIYTRQRLAHFKKNAIKCVFYMYLGIAF